MIASLIHMAACTYNVKIMFMYVLYTLKTKHVELVEINVLVDVLGDIIEINNWIKINVFTRANKFLYTLEFYDVIS